MSFNSYPSNHTKNKVNLGVDTDGFSRVYLASNGTPENHVRKVIEMMGGIENIVGENDIVLVKPNAQWWNQGMTNTDAIKAFIQCVLEIPGFAGEIIIADNHQYKVANSRAWTTERRNGSFNYNELTDYFQQKGFNNVTKYHWTCAGPNPKPLQGDGCEKSKRVNGPEDGDGYVWRDDIVYTAPNGKKCWMTYPIFTSNFSGLTIDLKNGTWKDGKYITERKLTFINFSSLNHHSWYSGVTASVKNLMGVVDMTCGFQGTEPKDAYNVHFIGVSKSIKFAKLIPIISYPLKKSAYRNFHYAGGALGKFMNSIRMPDLNIITAEWVGWGSRTDVNKSSFPKTILASRDPVALDYVAAKDILLKCTPAHEKGYRQLNDPSIKTGPFWKFLMTCNDNKIGNLDPAKIKIIRSCVQ